MSTILKALRRLEQEKVRSERPLREQVTGSGSAERPEDVNSRRWPVLIGGIGAGVVAGLAVLFFVLARGDSPQEPAAAEPAMAAAAAPVPEARPRKRDMIQPIPPAAARVVPAPSVAPPPFVAPEPEVSEEVAVLDRGAPAPRIAPDPDAPAPAIAPQEAGPGSVRPTHRRPRTPVAATPPRAAAAPIAEPPQAVTPATTAALRPAASAPTPAPPAPVAKPPRATEAPTPPPPVAKATSRPSAPAAAPFPALRVERTVWHPIAERRIAVIDVPGDGAREVREGDEVAGAVVALIEPSGVVFRHAGRDVRRKVGGGS